MASLVCCFGIKIKGSIENVIELIFHRLVGNIPGSKIAEGETLSEYVGSGPPEGKTIILKCPKRLQVTTEM